jgi:hypothetical protein
VEVVERRTWDSDNFRSISIGGQTRLPPVRGWNPRAENRVRAIFARGLFQIPDPDGRMLGQIVSFAASADYGG